MILKFSEFTPRTGSTKTWLVRSNATLGVIRWYGPWKRYAFLPANDIVLDLQHMDEIADFIEDIEKIKLVVKSKSKKAA